jgi:predicted HTH transcriptional regulator
MHYTINQLRKLISEGEGATLDFKKTITSTYKIAKTLAAFANCKGGSLLIGVHDTGNIVGAQVEEERYMIESAAAFFCSPEVFCNYVVHDYRELQVLEVQVIEGNNKPYSAKDEEGKWWVYIRVGDKSVLASKIVVDVLRRESSSKPSHFEFTSKEKALLEYLETHTRITLLEYCKLINISRRRAMRIIVNLATSGIIRVHNTEKTEFYTLS